MDNPLTAQDLWPLVKKLPPEEQLRLARLALSAATSGRTDEQAYRAMPPTAAEFSSEDDPLAWEGGGWEAFDAAR